MKNQMFIALGAALLLAACDSGESNSITAPDSFKPSYDVLNGIVDDGKPYAVYGLTKMVSPYKSTVIDSYAFSAQRDRRGDIGGEFLYSTQLNTGNALVGGRVTCMAVEGNKARLGGVVTYSSNPSMPVGQELTWSVSDNGLGALIDTGSPFLGASAELYCKYGLAYMENTGISGGYIVIMPFRGNVH